MREHGVRMPIDRGASPRARRLSAVIEQTNKLTKSIRMIFKDKKYPILIDQEGGRINRLNKIISFDNLTSNFFGKKYSNNYQEFKIYYKLFIDKTSHILRLIGVNINTTPVLSGLSKRNL